MLVSFLNPICMLKNVLAHFLPKFVQKDPLYAVIYHLIPDDTAEKLPSFLALGDWGYHSRDPLPGWDRSHVLGVHWWCEWASNRNAARVLLFSFRCCDKTSTYRSQAIAAGRNSGKTEVKATKELFDGLYRFLELVPYTAQELISREWCYLPMDWALFCQVTCP